MALAVEHGVPQAPALVAAVIRTLLAAEPGPAEVYVLQARADRDCRPDDVRDLLTAAERKGVELAIHDPHHRDALCYLAADEAGSPIYVNRRLFDADVVLPLGCLRLDAALGYYGANQALYPAFSDQPTLDRFDTAGVGATPDEIARRRHEADEVAWLIGVQMTIQVIPAAGGDVLDVLVGTSDAVTRRGKDLCQAAWSYEIPRGPTWSWPASKERPDSRRGKTSAERWRRQRGLCLTKGRSHFVPSWPTNRARHYGRSVARRTCRPRCGASANTIRPTPRRLTSWPKHSTACRSIC